MRAVKTVFVAKPGSIIRRLATLLIIRPAATSRPHDSAISNTTKALLILPIRKLDAPRVSSLRISLMSARDD